MCVIIYDWVNRLEALDLACDEAYMLAEEIAERYLRTVDKNHRCYESLWEFVHEIDFGQVLEECSYAEHIKRMFDIE
jgi:hypothetical protein